MVRVQRQYLHALAHRLVRAGRATVARAASKCIEGACVAIVARHRAIAAVTGFTAVDHAVATERRAVRVGYIRAAGGAATVATNTADNLLE